MPRSNNLQRKKPLSPKERALPKGRGREPGLGMSEWREQQKLGEFTSEVIAKIRAEPVWFAEQILNHRRMGEELPLEEKPEASWELDDFQKELLEACADVWRAIEGIPTRVNLEGRNYISIRSGHGPGKTHTAALIAHWFNAAFPGRIVAIAPKFKQLTTRLWPAFRKIAMRAQPWYRALLKINDTTVDWCGNPDWTMLAETAVQPENLAGHHENFQLVLLEEATGVTESLFPTIFGALSTGRLQILVMISNPTKRSGTFAASHLNPRESKDYFAYHVHVNKARRISGTPTGRKWMSKLISKYGENSPVVQVRVFGEFPTDDPHQLIATQYISDAFMRERPLDGSLSRLRISIDVADGGDAETIITACRHYANFKIVLKQRAFNFPAHVSPIMAADEAVKMFDLYEGSTQRGDDFVPDANGVGAGTAGTLIKLNYNVVAYRGGASSSNPKMFRNRRVQAYIALRNDFRDGHIQFADDWYEAEEDITELMAQLVSIKSKPDNERVEDIWTKKEMAAEGIKSPDRADSLAMQDATVVPTYAAGEQLATGNVEVQVIKSKLFEGYVRG